MVIAGLQKMTLLDYPGKVACTVFLRGCNFRCPFCHNSDLLGNNGPEEIPVETLMAFLKKRVGLLDAVCVTGGEPTLQKDLPQLLKQIKELGYLVKLDTNGAKPKVLKELVEAGFVDYVAMDIKNCPSRYGETAGVPKMDLAPIEESMGYLLGGAVDFEFRTTVAEELHGVEEMEAIGAWLKALSPERKCPRFFIQPYVDRDSVLASGLHTPTAEKLHAMADRLKPFVDAVSIRALD